MSSNKSQLEILAEEAERVRAELAAAQAKVEAEQEAAQKRRAAAWEEHDRKTLDEFDEAVLDQEVEQARAALAEAVLADPVWVAVARLNLAQLVRAETKGHYNATAARLGVEPLPYLVSAAWPVKGDDLFGMVDQEAQQRLADLVDARDQERVEVGNQAARRRS